MCHVDHLTNDVFIYRCHYYNKRYLLILHCVKVAQALVRGFICRRRSIKYRNAKVKEARHNLGTITIVIYTILL